MKTTKSNFNVFKSEVIRLLKLYGLIDWEYKIVNEYIDGITVSQTDSVFSARTVVFTLNTVVAQDMTTQDFKDSALHEVLELLLWRLEDMVCDCNKAKAREEVHSIIQTLINVKG